MIYEDLRAMHEDVERLEAAIADRILDDPKHVSIRCSHQCACPAELTTHRSAVA